MIILSDNASDAEVLAVVRRWVDLLADGNYLQAHALLNHVEAERNWPADLVEELIHSYELGPAVDSAGVSHVTRIDDARVVDVNPRPSVSRFKNSGRPTVIGDVHFDLPINGVWSDLTAIFFLRKVAGGIALEIFDIHVL